MLYDKSPFATQKMPPKSAFSVYEETDPFPLPDDGDLIIRNASATLWDANESGKLMLYGDVDFGVLFRDAQKNVIGGTTLGSITPQALVVLGSTGYTAVMPKESHWRLGGLANLAHSPTAGKPVPGPVAQMVFFVEGDVRNVGDTEQTVSLTLDASWELTEKKDDPR